MLPGGAPHVIPWPVSSRGRSAAHVDVAWRPVHTTDGDAFSVHFPSGWSATAPPDASRPLAKDADGTVIYQLPPPLHLPLPHAGGVHDATTDWLPTASPKATMETRRSAPAAASALRVPGGPLASLQFAVRIDFTCVDPPEATVGALLGALRRVKAQVAAKQAAPSPRPHPLPRGTSFSVPPPSPAPPRSPRRGLSSESMGADFAAPDHGLGSLRRLDALHSASASAASAPPLASASAADLKTIMDGVRWALPRRERGDVPKSLYVRAFAGERFVEVTLTLRAGDDNHTLAVTSHLRPSTAQVVRVPRGVVDDRREATSLVVGFLCDAHVAVAVNGALVDVVCVPEFPAAPQLLTVARTSHTRQASCVVVRDVAWARVDPPPPPVLARMAERHTAAAWDPCAFVGVFTVTPGGMPLTLQDVVVHFVHAPETPVAVLNIESIVVLAAGDGEAAGLRPAAGAGRATKKRTNSGATAGTASCPFSGMVDAANRARLLFVLHGDATAVLSARNKLPLFKRVAGLLSLPGDELVLKSIAPVAKPDVHAALADAALPKWTFDVGAV